MHSARATGEDTPCPTRASHSNCSYPTVAATSCICALPKAPAPSMAVSGCGFPQMTTLQLPTQAGSSIHSPHLIVVTQRALILLLGTAQQHRATAQGNCTALCSCSSCPELQARGVCADVMPHPAGILPARMALGMRQASTPCTTCLRTVSRSMEDASVWGGDPSVMARPGTSNGLPTSRHMVRTPGPAEIQDACHCPLAPLLPRARWELLCMSG